MDIAPWVLEVLACPACHAPLTPVESGDADGELHCTGDTCGLIYPVRDGIPVLLIDEARKPDAEST